MYRKKLIEEKSIKKIFYCGYNKFVLLQESKGLKFKK